MGEKTIEITVKRNGSLERIKTYAGEYLNLMLLLKEKVYLDDFGACGSDTGACGTCVVKASGISGESVFRKQNEPTTLKKIGFDDTRFRLSCQLCITEDLHGSEIDILR